MSELVEFRLPELGEGVSSGQIIGVFVSVGDSVSVEQPLIEVETDKAAVELPSPTGGTVTDVCVSTGDLVNVNELLVVIEGDSVDTKKTAPDPEEKKGKSASTQSPPKEPQKNISPQPLEIETHYAHVSSTESPGAVPAAPSVRRLARELGIDIMSVKGSGPRGRIFRKDVKLHTKAITTLLSSGILNTSIEPDLPDFSSWGETETESFSTVRKITAERLSQAWTAPHVTEQDKADISELERLRKLNKKKVAEQGGNLTMTAILVKVVSSLLLEYSKFNSSIHMGESVIVYKKYVNIGVAVDTERGLLVPVIKNTDKKSLAEIAVDLTDISKRAREKKVSPDELAGGTFTVTNLGGIGGTFFTPIINPPEVAILGASRASIEPAYVEGEFVPRLMAPLALSYDHRIIDGAEATRFLRHLCDMLENPRTFIFD